MTAPTIARTDPAVLSLTYLAEGRAYPVEVQARVHERDLDDPGAPPYRVISIGALDRDSGLLDGLHPDHPMTADDAEHLALLLIQAAARARRS